MKDPASLSNTIDVPTAQSHVRGARVNRPGKATAGGVKSRYSKLLPAPIRIEHVVTSTVRTLYAPTTSRCSVPRCLRPDCNLRSHRQYVHLARQRHRGVGADSAGASAFANVQGWPVLQPQLAEDIERDGVDGFPYLPVANGLDPELRQSFHHFFENVFDRLALIFRTPPIPMDFKPRMLSLALTNSAYCMALIAQSRIDEGIARGQYEEDLKSLTLYNRVIQVYQDHLAVAQPAQVDIFLLVIVILLSYDAIHGRIRSIHTHWEGMQQLVSWRGGIHNVGVSLAYVVHVDRVVATFVDKHPAYPLPADRSIQLSRPPRRVYGLAFEPRSSLSQVMSQRSLDHCIDTCRLMELFESAHISFDAKSSLPEPPGEVAYFYYSRDRLDGLYAVLHADLHGQGTMEESITLAARLAEYPITWSNYTPTLTVHLCTQLKQILEKQDVRSSWSNYLDVFTWILLVAAIAPATWEVRTWALTALYDVVSAKYGKKVWHQDWRMVEWRNARRFVWSDTHFKSKFNKVCSELETELELRSRILSGEEPNRIPDTSQP